MTARPRCGVSPKCIFICQASLRLFHPLVGFEVALQLLFTRAGFLGHLLGDALLVGFEALVLHIRAADADRAGLAFGVGRLGLHPRDILLHLADLHLLVLVSRPLLFDLGLALFQVSDVVAGVFVHRAARCRGSDPSPGCG